ncbi:hypothetical protein KV100_03850 [Mumia sp. zg.B21]|uniref:hypothetical protein n=1 Tax=Mumia sp. zg.B21 TaxID=2855447 RepID=UPI001C6E6C09|nr:hypothetical protein [Mumia sp. zg.B21]MBW9208778.1 hypothetical protein [Mumia sp. zg.B21]
MTDITSAVVDAQHGVLTSAQAAALFGAAHVRSRVYADVWQRPHRGVVVLHNGPLTAEQTTMVRLLSCSPGAVLAGPSALAYDGLTGFETDATYVSVPIGARRPSIGGIVVHWSAYLDHRDVNPARFPPRTRPARSVLDFASWTDNERYARAIVLAAAQQRVVRTSDLRDAMTRRGACRHRALVVESYLDAAGGIQSLPERDFDAIRARYRLPPPARQRAVVRNDKRYYLDVDWEEYGVGCEVHGIPHLDVRRWDADAGRGNELLISGRRTAVFTSYAIRRTPAAVGDQLRRLLQSAGWDGT